MSRQVKRVNISGKEDKSNKVISWGSTTTDAHYPSEKLVKDSLDGKANSTHNHTKSQITDFPTSMTPSSHTHGNLQNNGQVGSTAQASKNVVTDSSGKITTEDKPTIPSASSTTPSADTTDGSVGTGTTWARSNHTHPKSSLYAEATHNHTKSQITDFPSIPSKTSDLQNDSGFLISHQDISGKLDKAQTSYKGKNVVVDSSSGNITFEEKNNHTHSNYLTSTDISGKIDTAGTGLSKSGTTLNHSNSITALTTASFKKVKYDSQGHITGTSDVSASDLPTHTHSQYLTEHQDITGKEDKSNKVTSISSSSTDTQYPSAKCVYDALTLKVNDKTRATSTFFPQDYEDENSSECTWENPYKVTIADSGYLLLDFSSMLEEIGDRVYFNIVTNNTINVVYNDVSIYSSSDTKSLYIQKQASDVFELYLFNSDEFTYLQNTYTKTTPTLRIAPTTANSTTVNFGNKMWYHYMHFIDRVYPIGSIYMSVNSVNPQYIIGGQWERIEDRFLLASGSTYSPGSTGGSADAVVVSHYHSPTTSNNKFLVSQDNVSVNGTKRAWTSSGSSAYFVYVPDTPNGINENATTTTVGVSGTGKNMPPYIGVYMWKRIG